MDCLIERDNFALYDQASISSFPADDLLKRSDDLLEPALKGKIGTANNETGARAIGGIIKAKGEEFVRRLKDQEPRPFASTAAGLADMVITGEVPISFTMVQTNLTQPAATRGAPVGWLPMEVVPVNAGGAAVSVNAPHPHAALLLIDPLLSRRERRCMPTDFLHQRDGQSQL